MEKSLRGAYMKVFISWSGEKSRAVAHTLREWLPSVIQAIEPWMSADDIDAGARWNVAINSELKEGSFGIICLTKSNQTAPWIMFEAGALAKAIDGTHVVPYLIDLPRSDIVRNSPLTQFQAKQADDEGTWQIIKAINKSMPNPLLDEQLRRTFDKWWPELGNALQDLPDSGDVAEQPPKRTTDDLLEEILDLTRAVARQPISHWTEPNILRKDATLHSLLAKADPREASNILRDYIAYNFRYLSSSEQESLYRADLSYFERLYSPPRNALMNTFGIDKFDDEEQPHSDTEQSEGT
jgi:hypothetical protein